MKKFSFLIVCLCAGLAFVSQAQDTQRVAPASGDAPSLNGGRPSPWERPIGPGPVDHPNGGSGSGDVTDDDGSGGSPLDALTKATIRPNGPASGDTPSLQRRPRDWDEPIPGPLPSSLPNGWDIDKDGEGGVLPNIKPGGDQTNGGLRPGVDHGPIVWAPSHESGGSPMVADMIDGLLNGSTDVPDMNGDGKADISDVTTAINRLLRAQ